MTDLAIHPPLWRQRRHTLSWVTAGALWLGFAAIGAVVATSPLAPAARAPTLPPEVDVIRLLALPVDETGPGAAVLSLWRPCRCGYLLRF